MFTGLRHVTGNAIWTQRSIHCRESTDRLVDVVLQHPWDRYRRVGPRVCVYRCKVLIFALCSGITLPPILFIPYLERESYHGALIVALWRAAQIVIG
jgi:hypothetical protein